MKISRIFIAASLAFAMLVAAPRLQADQITHSADQSILSGNSVACQGGGIPTNNSYWRVFDLNSFGIFSDWQVDSVDIGIELAEALNPGANISTTINFYLDPSGDLTGPRTLIGSIAADIPDATALSVLNFAGGPLVPAGSNLAVEFFVPGDDTVTNLVDRVFVGSNNLGETGPSYLQAAACGLPDPTPTGAIGFPGMNIVMNINGTAIPEPSSIALLRLVLHRFGQP